LSGSDLPLVESAFDIPLDDETDPGATMVGTAAHSAAVDMERDIAAKLGASPGDFSAATQMVALPDLGIDEAMLSPPPAPEVQPEAMATSGTSSRNQVTRAEGASRGSGSHGRISTLPAIEDSDFFQITGEVATPAAGASALCGRQIGPYKIVSLLGSGGMADVYLAVHTQIGRHVALKRLQDTIAKDRQMVLRFFQEARAVNKIKHKNIIDVTDFIDYDEGNVCYVMEYLEGQSLEDLIAKEGQLHPVRAVHIALQIASAVQAAHAVNIIHRDLKPANIFVLKDGEPDFIKLLDFGVSKTLRAEVPGAQQRTAIGVMVGTPKYMSPEQARGDASDKRSDIYSFGVMLYEMLTGQNPFSGRTTMDVLVKQMSFNPNLPSATPAAKYPVPTELDQLAMCCLAKDPANRPQSFDEIVELLESIGARLATGDIPIGRLASSPRYSSSRTIKVAALVGVVSAAIVVIVVALAWRGISSSSNAKSGLGNVPATAPAITPGQDQEVGGAGREAAKSGAATALSMVSVRVRSRPSGAEVFREGETEAEGRTPFALPLERGTASVRLTLRLAGYRDAVLEIIPDRDKDTSASLLRQAAGKKRPRGAPGTGEGRTAPQQSFGQDGTIDPFK